MCASFQEVQKRLKVLIDEIGAKEGGKAFFDPVSIPKYTGESLTAVQVGFKKIQHGVDPDAKISPNSLNLMRGGFRAWSHIMTPTLNPQAQIPSMSF